MKIYPASPKLSPLDLASVTDLFLQGHLLAIPTETVYGLSALLSEPASIQKIYAIKNRPFDKPLIIHISALSQLESIIDPSPLFLKLAALFWPGPLTLIARHLPSFSSPATANSATIAIRITSHPCALQLIDALGIPLVATSANSSGAPSPVSAQQIHLEGISAIVDAGPTPYGIESTIVSLIDDLPVVVREGAISLQQLKDAGLSNL